MFEAGSCKFVSQLFKFFALTLTLSPNDERYIDEEDKEGKTLKQKKHSKSRDRDWKQADREHIGRAPLGKYQSTCWYDTMESTNMSRTQIHKTHTERNHTDVLMGQYKS